VIHAHEVFHLLVMLGAAFHWVFVYKISDIPISKKLVIKVVETGNNTFMAYVHNESKKFEGENIDHIKEQIQTWVNSEFHQNYKPQNIRLKFFKEEILS
jgi:hypothetical protein